MTIYRLKNYFVISGKGSKNAITEVYYERPGLSEEEYHARYCKLINGKWVVVRSPPCSACGFKGYDM